MVTLSTSPSLSTLVILLGASDWPYAPEFKKSEAFSNSAQGLKEYFLDPSKFGLTEKNLLDLFDSDLGPDDIDIKIRQFLNERIPTLEHGLPAKDLLVFYVGHGGFDGKPVYDGGLLNNFPAKIWTSANPGHDF